MGNEKRSGESGEVFGKTQSEILTPLGKRFRITIAFGCQLHKLVLQEELAELNILLLNWLLKSTFLFWISIDDLLRLIWSKLELKAGTYT